MRHPHHDVLIAIAENAEAINDFEISHENWEAAPWAELIGLSNWIFNPEEWIIRRKQKTIKVNGFDVPEPCRKMLAENALYYIPQFCEEELFTALTVNNDNYDRRVLRRGLMHLTKEAAIAHAKAMLGIDPKEEA